ncbi:MAG: hypothetical protein AABN95_25975 [Acidobacteriota bacterium]
MSDSLQQDTFAEPRSSATLKLIAALSALLITVLVFVGYAYLRKRHAADNAASIAALPTPEPRKSPKALIMVDEALLKGGTTTIGGIVKNTSSEAFGSLSVEIELKRRKDAGVETKVVPLHPAQLEPQQEGRYSLQVKAQDYGSARVVGLRTGSDSASLPFTTAQGQKRPPERLESKTVLVDKPRSKAGEFINTPDNPSRVP